MTTKAKKVKQVETVTPIISSETNLVSLTPTVPISYRNKLISQIGIEAVRLREKEQRLASKLRKQATTSS